MPEALRDYWEILNNIEDLLNGGVTRSHAELVIPRGQIAPQEKGADTGRRAALAGVEAEVKSCEKCDLCKQRKNTVPGEGTLDPQVMFIGEGPGADEDSTGIPFVGKAGQYLDKWIEAIGLSRAQHCFIGNVVKCRPPGNRDPEPEEMKSCLPYLYRQIDAIRPKAIVTLGRISSQVLCKSTLGIGKLRGGSFDYLGIPIIPTYHPSGVLRNPEYRSAVWEDLKIVKRILAEAD